MPTDKNRDLLFIVLLLSLLCYVFLLMNSIKGILCFTLNNISCSDSILWRLPSELSADLLSCKVPICTHPFTGCNCNEVSCENNAQLEWRGTGAECHCERGYVGANCEFNTSKGEICHESWYGEYCTHFCHDNLLELPPICLESGPQSCQVCSGNGICNSDGECECNTGHTGQLLINHGAIACQTHCTENCSGHGRCYMNSCICSPGWTRRNGLNDTCSECSIGYFKPTERQRTNDCIACPIGHYMDKIGKRVCKHCELGTFSNDYGNYNCTLCAYGTFANTITSSTCDNCPYASQMQNELGQCVHVNCTSGQFGRKDQLCKSCPVAYVSLELSTLCKRCSSGTYMNQTTQSICKACPTDFYSDWSGQRICKKCQHSHPSNSSPPGATACKASPMLECENGTLAGIYGCVACSIGKYWLSTASIKASCLHCQYGDYQSESGKSSCKNCPLNFFSPHKGATTCKICPYSYTSNTSAYMCEYFNINPTPSPSTSPTSPISTPTPLPTPHIFSPPKATGSPTHAPTEQLFTCVFSPSVTCTIPYALIQQLGYAASYCECKDSLGAVDSKETVTDGSSQECSTFDRTTYSCHEGGNGGYEYSSNQPCSDLTLNNDATAREECEAYTFVAKSGPQS